MAGSRGSPEFSVGFSRRVHWVNELGGLPLELQAGGLSLVIAGLRGFFTQQLEQLVRDLRVENQVELTGWIERRGLPARKIGRLWKFKLSEVDKWVRDGGADASEVEQGGYQ